MTTIYQSNSLDCKEGHMKKIRLSVCIEVKRTAI